MGPEIRTTPIEYTLAGLSLAHEAGKPFGQEIMALLGRVWPVIKAKGIPNDGINRVVYDQAGGGHGSEGSCSVFAGLVLSPEAAWPDELERKTVRLARYAYWQHTGPYHLIPVTGAAMRRHLDLLGERTQWPLVEVYGHWTADESRLVTETFVALQ